MEQSRITVLLIEDDPDDAGQIRRMLSEAQGAAFEVQCTGRLSEGLLRLSGGDVDVVLLDLGLPDSIGLDTFTAARAAAADLPIVVLTGVEEQEVGLRAAGQGAQDYLVKSQINADLLARTLRYAVARASAQRRQSIQRQVLANLNSQRCLDMDALGEVLAMVKDSLRVRMAALRLQLGEDWPLHVALGFSDDLRERAELLCSVGPDGEVRRDAQGRLILDCLCGDVLQGIAVDDSPAYTERGSFWSSHVPDTVSALGRASGLGAVRACCTCGGCASVALIPLRSEHEIIGLLQFADPEAGAFSPETVELLEDVAESIGTALTRQRAEDALAKYAGRIEVLRQVDEAILSAQSVQEVAQAALSHLPELVPCRRATVMEFDLDAHTALVLAAYDERGDTTAAAGTTLTLDVFGDLEGFRANRIRTVVDLRVATAPSPAARNLMAGGVRSFLTVPLLAEGELIGCLNVGWPEPGTIAQEDQEIARELAEVLAIAIGSTRGRQKRETAERALDAVNYQMRVARGIQQALYPASAPQVPGFELAGASVSAEAAGGDYYDYIAMPDGFLGIAVGDVTGHGVGAALVMAAMRAYLRAFAHSSTDLSEIMGRANLALVADTAQDIFCTMLLARLDPRTGAIAYVNAGHPPGYLFDASGKVRAELGSTAVPLGMVPETEFPAGPPLTLQPGEMAFLYTDGVLDVASGAGSRFGRQHVLDVVLSNRGKPAEQAVREVCRAVLRFCDPELPADDITAVLIKALPVEADPAGPHPGGP